MDNHSGKPRLFKNPFSSVIEMMPPQSETAPAPIPRSPPRPFALGKSPWRGGRPRGRRAPTSRQDSTLTPLVRPRKVRARLGRGVSTPRSLALRQKRWGGRRRRHGRRRCSWGPSGPEQAAREAAREPRADEEGVQPGCAPQRRERARRRRGSCSHGAQGAGARGLGRRMRSGGADARARGPRPHPSTRGARGPGRRRGRVVSVGQRAPARAGC